MRTVGTILAAVVGLLHVYFAVLEMLLWDKPAGRRAFGHSREFGAQTKVMAANQGLYNLFLAAGLGWGLVAPDDLRLPLLSFFLGCVVVAGVFGALTASRKILYVQALPAAAALLAVVVGGS